MFERIKSEPAIVAGIVQAVLGLLLAFGVNLSTEQIGAIMAVTAAGLALFVRSQVVPLAPMRGIGRGEDGITTFEVIVVVCLVLLTLLAFGFIHR